MTTDGEIYSFHAETTRDLELIRNLELWQLFPQVQLLDQPFKVHIVKILDECGMEVAIPSICRPKDTSHVVISREIERFVNETHQHKAEVRSSA